MNSKKVIIVRAALQAKELAAKLDVNAELIFAPMVQIEPVDAAILNYSPDVIIFTSANAVRRFESISPLRGCLVYCVGATTKAQCVALGFKDIRVFETADELIKDLVCTQSTNKRIYYPRGKSVSVDIYAKLKNARYSIDQQVLYQQVYVPMSGVVKSEIESSSIVLPILSKEMAKHMANGLESVKPKDLTIICISQYVAEVFNRIPNITVKKSSSPTQEALITAIRAELSD